MHNMPDDSSASQNKKYRVPALDKAHRIIHLISQEPHTYTLSDLAKKLAISKSSMFSLLHTMEDLGWLAKDEKDTYSLGLHFGLLGNAFFARYDIVDLFHQEAAKTRAQLDESIHLARLIGTEVLHLAKETSSSVVQMVSGPGATFAAHATGLGKILLAALSNSEVEALYPQESLPALTPNTISSREALLRELEEIRTRGYSEDLEEGLMGFNCVAALLVMKDGTHAAVSMSIPVHKWEDKKSLAREAITRLAGQLTLDPENHALVN
ncbi:IclR family transcriptional regulator [Paenibacillus daejeonensis]|uniref:IclR family transcriptional regulator n=1 Tax=Paenibacillus daejeonensis TaxID=135193 RepID=UPI000362FBC5|nr:IclR family transcriptional regulator [Paenibacillus daejeonensis]